MENISISQILFACLGFGLIHALMYFTKQYVLVGSAAFVWVFMCVLTFWFSNPTTI